MTCVMSPQDLVSEPLRRNRHHRVAELRCEARGAADERAAAEAAAATTATTTLPPLGDGNAPPPFTAIHTRRSGPFLVVVGQRRSFVPLDDPVCRVIVSGNAPRLGARDRYASLFGAKKRRVS